MKVVKIHRAVNRVKRTFVVKCLMCSKTFQSESTALRICRRCKPKYEAQCRERMPRRSSLSKEVMAAIDCETMSD